MSNDIARQLAHLPEAEAVERLVTHLRSFWTPAMRAGLVALARSGSADLDPLVVRAAAAL